METMKIINNIEKLRAEQKELIGKLEGSLAIESEHPDIFNNGSIILKHYGKMLPDSSRKFGVSEAYWETSDFKKIPISKELCTRLTGKTVFHPDYNKHHEKG